ncbi:MAG: CARDB domain-containing protein [Candidatus Buchananbacteria bacterium]
MSKKFWLVSCFVVLGSFVFSLPAFGDQAYCESVGNKPDLTIREVMNRYNGLDESLPDNLYLPNSLAFEVDAATGECSGISGTNVDIYDSNVFLKRIDIPGIISNGAGGNSDFFVWTPGSLGSHNLSFTVDPDNTINEINESNNAFTKNIVVANQPSNTLDLRFKLIGSNDLSNPLSNQTLNFISQFEINGNTDSINQLAAVWYLDNVPMDTDYLNVSGSTKLISPAVSWTATPGNHVVKIVLDPNNTIPEIDETNNSGSISFTVAAINNNITPSITNVDVSEALPDQASVHFRVSGVESENSQPKVEYGTTPELGLNSAWGSISDVDDTTYDFDATLNGLQLGTRYYYRAVVILNNQKYQSDVYQFTTPTTVSEVINITTPTVTNLSAVSAAVKYIVTGRSTSNPSLCFSTSQANILGNCSALIVSGQKSSFFETSYGFIGLQPGTTYYYQLVLDKGASREVKDRVYSLTTPPNGVVVIAPQTIDISATEKKYIERVAQLEYRISDLEKQVVQLEKNFVTAVDSPLTQQVKGRILLQVENNGEAWYVDPATGKKFFLKDGQSAYTALNAFGLGITNADLSKIPIGFEQRFNDVDTDGDGLSDKLEEAIGSNVNMKDSDADGYDDKTEALNGYSPIGSNKFAYNADLINTLKGKIVLQVDSRGQAWYINPVDGKRYYMKDGDQAYQIMRFLSLGITNENLHKIAVGDL